MSIEKTIQMTRLFDIYKELLTDKQKEMLALYYEEDYSLAEIAEHYNISRQGVHDNIQRGEKSLERFENLLHIRKKSANRIDFLTKLAPLVEDNPPAQALVSELKQLED